MEIEKRRLNTDKNASNKLAALSTKMFIVDDIKNNASYDQTSVISSAADEFLSLSGGSALEGDGLIPAGPAVARVLSTNSTFSASSNDSSSNLPGVMGSIYPSTDAVHASMASTKRKPTIKISGGDSPKKKKSKIKIEY